MADLSDNEVLSILNKMDSEQQFFEQMNAARAQVRGVIERYQKIAPEMATLTQQRDTLTADIANLTTTLEAKKADAKAQIQAVTDDAMKKAQASLGPLQLQVKTLADQVSMKQTELDTLTATAEGRKNMLDRQIAEAQAKLDALVSDFAEFKNKHGIA